MADKLRPEQIEVTTGTSNNDTLPTLGKVEDLIGVENLWDRVTGPANYLKPYNAGDYLHLNEAENASYYVTADVQIFRNATPDISMWAATATATADSNLNLVRSRGTIASPVALQDGDFVGNINFVGFSDASTVNNAAEITAEINGTPSSSNLPCDLSFKVNVGGAVATEKMRLLKTGVLKIDQIAELTPTVGVTIESLLHDGQSIAGSNLYLTAASGNLDIKSSSGSGLVRILDDLDNPALTFNNTLDAFVVNKNLNLDNVTLTTNTINTFDSLIGVTIEGVPIKTGNVGSTTTRVTKGWFTDLDMNGSLTFNSGTFALVTGTSVNEISTVIGPLSTDNQIGTCKEIFDSFAYLNGKTGGQTLKGGFASGNNLDLESTAHATKGEVRIRDGSDFLFDGGGTGLFKVEPNADAKISLGRSIISSPTTDVAYWSHYDLGDSNTDYAIKQLSSGRTAINATTGQRVDFNVNNAVQGYIDETKLDITNYINQAGIFAEIYVADASASQTIATGATYTKSTAFTTNGQSSNCTADVTNDKITITQTGRYRVSGSFSGTSGTAGITFRGAAFLNSVEQNQIHWKRKFATNTDSGDMSFTGFIDVTSVPWDLDFRLRHDSGTDKDITLEYANLNVEYIGST